MTPLTVETSIHDILIQHGYKLIDDEWEKEGRRTYLHNENASGEQIRLLKGHFESVGWKKDHQNLWSFRHPVSGEILELEPGGHDTSGHFLHHMKAFD